MIWDRSPTCSVRPPPPQHARDHQDNMHIDKMRHITRQPFAQDTLSLRMCVSSTINTNNKQHTFPMGPCRPPSRPSRPRPRPDSSNRSWSHPQEAYISNEQSTQQRRAHMHRGGHCAEISEGRTCTLQAGARCRQVHRPCVPPCTGRRPSASRTRHPQQQPATCTEAFYGCGRVGGQDRTHEGWVTGRRKCTQA